MLKTSLAFFFLFDLSVKETTLMFIAAFCKHEFIPWTNVCSHRPIERLLPVLLQRGVDEREAFTVVELVEGQRRRMRRFDHRVFAFVDQLLFRVCETAPQEKDEA